MGLLTVLFLDLLLFFYCYLCCYSQSSKLGRIAHREILIIIVFRNHYLGDAFENCYLPHNFLKDLLSKSNIATEVVLPWVCSAITKVKHLADACSRIFTLHSSST